MLQPVILDTDVASLLHKGRLPDPLMARITGRPPLITFVTYGELTTWAQIRHWGGRNRQALADWLTGVYVIPGDETVALTWGRLAAAAHQRGRRARRTICGSQLAPLPMTCPWPR